MSADERINERGAQVLCKLDDLIPNSGVCALADGEQIALFYIPDASPPVYAIGNHDPLGKANVLSRGIIGDINSRLVVASPLYKQHYDLTTGECLEDESVSVPIYAVQLLDGKVILKR